MFLKGVFERSFLKSFLKEVFEVFFGFALKRV